MVRGLTEQAESDSKTASSPLPDTVHAAVQARMDLLSAHERAILQLAAVASRGIRPSMLRAVLTEYSAREIDEALDGLMQRDMLVQAEGDSFAFRHILIRDVAYGTLSRSERIRIHSQIADWLAESAGEQADQLAELIAYHYREAVLLSKQAAVPRPMPHETQQAVHFLEKAGEQASRAGAFAEATTYLQQAISLAPEAEHVRLNEKLGDCVAWGATALDAYSKALELWQASPAHDALMGSRIARKRYVIYTRYPTGRRVEQAEKVRMWQEAMQLAQEANDVDSQWLLRALDASIDLTEMREPQVIEQAIMTCHEAVQYFEVRENWILANTAIDMVASLSWTIDKHQDALEASQRRLTIPGLASADRGDAHNMIATTHFLYGHYDQCMATVQEALHNLHAGEPVEYLAVGVTIAMWTAYMTGQWAIADSLAASMQEIWERLQHHPGTTQVILGSSLAQFLIALAREDRPQIDATASVIERAVPRLKERLQAYRDDDFTSIAEIFGKNDIRVFITLLTEHELPVQDELLAASAFQEDMHTWVTGIATALQANNNEQIARAIDAAEQHGLIVYAARMRIVLARRSKDRSQLERARPVLERLKDRQHLRKLAEVAHTLAL